MSQSDPGKWFVVDTADRMSANDVSEYFDNEAAGWDRRYKTSRLFRLRYQVFSKAIAEYGAGSERSLDYGCGSGALTGLLRQHSKEVVAADVAENMRRITREKYQTCPDVHVTSVESLEPLGYDLIVCSSVVEYVDQPEEFLQGLTGLLRPRGTMLITFANRYGPLQICNRWILQQLRRHSYAVIQRNVFSTRTIRHLTDELRLEIVSLKTPIGLPLLSQLGLGELYFLVAKKR